MENDCKWQFHNNLHVLTFSVCVSIQAFYYPAKAGFPIGTADSPKHYMLEMHYDNPEGIEGQYLQFAFFIRFCGYRLWRAPIAGFHCHAIKK